MTVFEFSSYKHFLREKLRSLPKKGHGQLRKIAELLNVHTTMVTHVFRGKANFSVEQGLKICAFFGLGEAERDYFITLLHQERASSPESREYFQKQLSTLRERALHLSAHVKEKITLDEKDQAIFYSYWHFSAIRLLTAIKGFQDPHRIAAKLRIDVKKVHQALRFLTSVGLCREENGKYHVGVADTFVGTESPLLARHLENWRMKAIEHLVNSSAEEIAISYPVVVSEKDFLQLRKKVLELLEEFRAIAGPSPSEELCCLNIDWFRVGRT